MGRGRQRQTDRWPESRRGGGDRDRQTEGQRDIERWERGAIETDRQRARERERNEETEGDKDSK